MFPIIPSHMLRQAAPAATRSPLTGDHHLWSVWTDNILNGNNFVRHRQEAKLASPLAECCSESDSESDRTALGCFAGTAIPKGCHSRAVESFEMCGATRNVHDKQIRLRPSSVGTLQAEANVPDHQWIKSMKLSNDTQSNNAVLETTNQKQLHVRISKNVQPGEEILLWFSEEILALMYIPFLTPANIRGKNCYTCNICEKSYENPNPLKLHLATNCNRYTQNELWQRLDQSTARQQYIYHPPSYVSPEWMLQQQRLHLHGAPQPSAIGAKSPRLSAFQPVHSPHARYPQPASDHRGHAEAPVKSVANAAAHLETIVSNMGTSKNGHLCIYCGKLYSRKYGLKIHIRTHTGFKPLKCKFCFRPFGDPSNLNKHVRLHVQSNTLYKCNICEKILVRRRDLQRHMQTRHHQMSAAEDMHATLDGGHSSSSSSSSGRGGNASGSSSDEEDSKLKTGATQV